MANINLVQMLIALKNGNPQQIAESLIQQNFPNDPMMAQLLQMGRNNDVQGTKKLAQQFFAQQGKDFGAEMDAFMKMLRNLQASKLYIFGGIKNDE